MISGTVYMSWDLTVTGLVTIIKAYKTKEADAIEQCLLSSCTTSKLQYFFQKHQTDVSSHYDYYCQEHVKSYTIPSCVKQNVGNIKLILMSLPAMLLYLLLQACLGWPLGQVKWMPVLLNNMGLEKWGHLYLMIKSHALFKCGLFIASHSTMRMF